MSNHERYDSEMPRHEIGWAPEEFQIEAGDGASRGEWLLASIGILAAVAAFAAAYFWG